MWNSEPYWKLRMKLKYRALEKEEPSKQQEVLDKWGGFGWQVLEIPQEKLWEKFDPKKLRK